MRIRVVVGLMLCLGATVALGQPSGPMPAPTAPPQAAPIPPVSPVNPFTADSPELAFLLSLPRLLGRPLTFVVVFLFVGLVFTALVRHVILPRLGEAHYDGTPDAGTVRRLAIGNLVVWAIALFAAGQAAGLEFFGTVLKGVLQLVGTVIGGAFWLVGAGLIAYAVSPRGQDLVLGLLGWWHLQWHPNKPAPDQEFDLGDGVRARLVTAGLVQSTMEGTDGKRYTVPNAWLMRTHFGWPADTPPPPAGPVATERPEGM
ncbi:MAG: hypothetical protein KKI08_26250 [Armatimonadetes bacterium]|nr:hypothetical protein [Armatimonadota bacterium]